MMTTMQADTGLVPVQPAWTRQKFLEQLAVRLRGLYISEVRRWYHRRHVFSEYRSTPRWDGGRSEAGRTYTPVWPRLADFVLRRRLDEVAFLKAQFDCAVSGPPYPNQIMNDQAIGRYLDAIRQLPAMLEQSFIIQNRLAITRVESLKTATHWSDAVAWSYVLSHPEIELTALFRFCVADSAGLPKVKEVFRTAALMEYVRHRDAYDRILGNWIAEELRADAAGIFST